MCNERPEPLGGHTILIVDDDLGFMCWLGEIVTEAGYQAVPALDRLQAAALVNELNLQIDLVVMNPGLPGVSQMIETLSRRCPSLKIVAIQNAATDDSGAIQDQFMLERPSGPGPFSRQEWFKRVQVVIRKALAARAGV